MNVRTLWHNTPDWLDRGSALVLRLLRVARNAAIVGAVVVGFDTLWVSPHFINMPTYARRDVAHTQLRAIAAAQERFRESHGRYTDRLADLDVPQAPHIHRHYRYVLTDASASQFTAWAIDDAHGDVLIVAPPSAEEVARGFGLRRSIVVEGAPEYAPPLWTPP